ncbi:CPBP family intramembrane metalloprotease [Chryseobacterium nematophagum]|uniref:CPBP family intramembrane metalloprotease n=2 Tax=Chryseobacterium nematophagum TaxID=2305228 RepID=A0A3M7TDZ7_9FLAO|nr:CPBP family intramembrane metalloprotease [Chryseobacterium nematophagum]
MMKKILNLLFISFILSVINGYIFLFLNRSYFHLRNNKIQDLSQIELGFLSLIIAPIIETIIFQFLLYAILNSIFKIKNEYLIIVLMSTAFSLSHTYNWLYMCSTFIGGILLNNFYIKVLKMKNKNYAVWLTIFFHFLYNLYGFLFTM